MFAAAAAALIAPLFLAAPGRADIIYMGQPPARSAPDTSLTIKVHPLAPGVYAARVRYGWVGWFEQGKEITLVDATMDDEAAAALEDTIRVRSGGLPITHVVLTHSHDDHIRGARRFLDKGAKMIAQAQVSAAIDSALGRPHVTTAASKGAEPPTINVDHRLVLGKGPTAAEVIWLGHPAHTIGDLIVYLPKARVLFAGDVVSYKAVPWMLDPGMNVDGWKASVDSIMTSRFEADSLVPGHGQIEEKRKAAGWTKRYLQDAWDRAAYYSGAKTKVTSYKDWGDLGAYTDVEFYIQTHFMNMRRLWYETQGIKTPGRPRARALDY